MAVGKRSPFLDSYMVGRFSVLPCGQLHRAVPIKAVALPRVNYSIGIGKATITEARVSFAASPYKWLMITAVFSWS